ncbi:MAG: translation initiation factor IF-3, partial [Paludibacteraceae bacterium]|nr:translation initiation factor IF-3 [Paludibacteraceae bacterium]
GEELLSRFCVDLEEYGKPDKVPTLEGKRMIVMISPKSKKQ